MPEHPSLPPNLQGAIDLTDPVQKVLSSFKAVIAEQRIKTVVLVGLSEDGNVALTFHAPGGTIQALGLLAAASSILTQRQGPTEEVKT